MEESSVYFSHKEMSCNCGCGKIVLVPSFLDAMDELREGMNRPMIITSWTRCRRHNQSVGGSKLSSHLIGKAADIFTPTLEYRMKLLFLAGQLGFRGAGVGKDFIHLDRNDAMPKRRFWTYNVHA